jgi:pimeloyl-ACP methyl ester carboxylesterase
VIARRPLFGALIVLACTAAGAAATASDADVSRYLHAQRLVDVGGRRINLYCTGSGSPTVVLDTDGDDGTPAWRFVQPALAKRTRVCSYDAAGLGFSDPATTALDAAAAVADLHRLVTRAGIKPPLVIVGYALSGLSARLYADRYPRDVAGMVLVAPNVPYQRERIPAIAPVLAAPFAHANQYDERCLRAAQRGAIRPGTPLADCIYTPPDPTMPAPLKALIQRQWQRPGTWRDFASRDRSEKTSSAEVLREQRTYGSMPLIVLTTTKDILTLPIPPTQKARLAAAWMLWHERIAALSSAGTNVLVADSTQSIPIDRPVRVVSAIEQVVDRVRSSRAHP